jgi:hypothetical protein
MSAEPLPRANVVAARIAAACWLLGWVTKFAFLRAYLFGTVVANPIEISFFPAWLRAPGAAQAAYVLPALALPMFVSRRRIFFCLAAAAFTIASALLLLHQDTHNDATFVTSFWAALWLAWLACGMRRADEAFTLHARSLALCVVGLMFLGGFVGKLTPEYWSGQALADIFLDQKDGAISMWCREHYGEETIREWFKWLSRFTIVGEGVLALSPLLPWRLVFWFGVPFMAAVAVYTTWPIFSVFFCLIGLIVAVKPPKPRRARAIAA